MRRDGHSSHCGPRLLIAFRSHESGPIISRALVASNLSDTGGFSGSCLHHSGHNRVSKMMKTEGSSSAGSYDRIRRSACNHV